MITEQLQKKIDRAITLLKSFDNPDEPIEVAYSGGKDSDVILQLVKESGVNYRAIYKNTTIDPAGTIAHAKAMGAEMIRPDKPFFKLIENNGLPNRFMRFCCSKLKEYKVLNKSVIGVRKAESTKRAARYSEPTECKWYGAHKEANHVEAIYPILDWTDDDVVAFVEDRHIKLHSLYYREDGTIDAKRRLGCMCCPLQSIKKRQEQFKQHPRMVKAYVRALDKFRQAHPDSKSCKNYATTYEQIVRDFFFEKQKAWDDWRSNIFGAPDCKKYLEDYFNISL